MITKHEGAYYSDFIADLVRKRPDVTTSRGASIVRRPTPGCRTSSGRAPRRDRAHAQMAAVTVLERAVDAFGGSSFLETDVFGESVTDISHGARFGLGVRLAAASRNV
jgi:hypothetical protein